MDTSQESRSTSSSMGARGDQSLHSDLIDFADAILTCVEIWEV